MAEVFDFGLQQHKIKMDGKFFENNLFAVAGDTGRRLEVQLLDSDNMIQNTNGISLRLNANVAGQATYAEATLVDATKGLYELDLPNGMLIAPGNWQFQWQIIGATGEKLHSFAFMGSIGSNLAEGATEGVNFYLNLQDLKDMQEDFINGSFDSTVLETNIAEKLNNLEEQYAPKLTEVTAQLADIAIVDVTSFGAVSGKDSTQAINNAINSLTRGKVIIPDGDYLIDTEIAVRLKSNVDLELTDNAILRAIPTSTNSWRNVVVMKELKNSNITGGQIYGERESHFDDVSGKVWEDYPFLPNTLYNVGDIFYGGHHGYTCVTSGTTSSTPPPITSSLTTGQISNGSAVFQIKHIGEDGHCLQISNSQDITIRNTKFFNALGDGIFAYYPTNKNIEFVNIETDNCKRQGLSVIYSNSIKIVDSAFRNTNGNPGAGIDIEPNNNEGINEEYYPDNTMIENCIFEGNNWGVLLANASINTTIKECKFTNNAYQIGVVGAKKVKIEGCDFYAGSKTKAGIYMYKDSENIKGKNNTFYGDFGIAVWIRENVSDYEFTESNFDAFTGTRLADESINNATFKTRSNKALGGRNLLINTNKKTTVLPKSLNRDSQFIGYTASMSNGELTLTRTTSGGYARFYFNIDDDYPSDTHYILGFLGKTSDAASLKIDAYYNTATEFDKRISTKSVPLSTTYKKTEIGFHVPKEATSVFIMLDIPVGSSIVMKNKMLEKATIVSDHRPAHEDFMVNTAGTFTPKLAGSTTAGAPTYLVNNGYFERFGNILYVTCYIEISSKGGMTGNVSIGGLPIPSRLRGFGTHGGNISNARGITTSGGQLVVRLAENSSNIGIHVLSGVSAIPLNAENISDSTLLSISMMYVV